jgi:peroxiredoxin
VRSNDPLRSGVLVQLAFIAVAAVGVYSFVRAAQSDVRRASCNALCSLNPSYAGRDRLAPDFELPTLDGQKVRLSSFRGKTVFLNFWTRTCRPCLEEMPALRDLADALSHRPDMVVLTVSTDESADEVRDTLKVVINGPVPFPVLSDPEGKVVRELYGTRLFPETWVIDPKGVIRARFDGARDWSASLAIEVGDMVQKPSGCPIDFFKGEARGRFAAVCEDDS